VTVVQESRSPAPPAPSLPPLAELADLVVLHAKAQGIAPATCRRVLAGLRDGEDQAAWPRAWSALAHQHLAAGRPLAACRHFVLARFPFAGDPERRHAAAEAVAAFDSWRRRTGQIDRLELDLAGGRVACWTAGLDPRRPQPLLVVLGGIVSVKEQWAPFLRAARRLGMAVLVTEMPGVGENTLRYGPAATDIIPQLLDQLGATVCAPGVLVVALSFAGHLALAAAGTDPRIRGVLTVGAPVHELFTDPAVWARLPRTTTATLAHLTGTTGEATARLLTSMALQPADLAALEIPVRYVASRRDEIIPRREWELLAEHVADFAWVEYDDVHGSPEHLTDTRMWLLHHVLALRGASRAAALLRAGLTLRGRSPRTGTTASGTATPPGRIR
jgi:hypothetical protein